MICWLSLSPTLTPASIGVSDKFAHITAYAGAAILAGFGFVKLGRRMFALAVIVALAGLLEVLQIQIAGRSGDIVDFMTSVLGVAVGLAVNLLLGARKT